MIKSVSLILFGVLVSLFGPVGQPDADSLARSIDGAQATSAAECFVIGGADLAADPDPPTYYRIDLVPTRSVPRTRSVEGYGDMFYQASPFGIAIGSDGSYQYKISVTFDGLPVFDGKNFVVWLTTPDLKNIRKVGVIDENGRIDGLVDWNKFLVVVSLEDATAPEGQRWSGPIAYRGMSRSGLMHTMAGHGPFEQEPCLTFGYQ